MPMYVKNHDGALIKIRKAAEAGGRQTIEGVLEKAEYRPPTPKGRTFTDAAKELLGEKLKDYGGKASGKDGSVLVADARAWLDEQEA